MTHGDDQGLKLPPRIAPIQAVVVPIWRKPEEKAAVAEHVARVRAAVGDRARLWVDDRDQYTPGWKYNEHELRGVPLRLEVGPKDVANSAVMSVRRDTRAKESIPVDRVAERLPALLEEIQRDLFDAARKFRDEQTVRVNSIEELEAHFEQHRGFVAIPWRGDAALEARIKERTGATLRCFPLADGGEIALFARAY
jgi:prolyl-tRNA synthetase